MQIIGMVFHAIAPLSSILLGWINFNIFGMPINKYNSVGLLLVLATIIYQILVYFKMVDLTKEPGYKSFIQLDDEKNDEMLRSHGEFTSLSDVFSNIDIVLIMVAVFLGEFMNAQLEIGINTVAVLVFTWTIQMLAGAIIVGFIMAIGIMKVLQKFHSETDTRFLFIILFIVDSFLINALSLPLGFNFTKLEKQSSLLLTILTFKVTTGYYVQVFSSCLLFVVIPSHSWCFVIGIRRFFFTLAGAFGYLFATSFFNVGSFAYPGLSILCLLMASTLLINSPNFLKKYC